MEMQHDATLFDGTAEYYARYRAGYPAAAIDDIVATFGLGPSTKVLDLGSGTGQVASPLARLGVPVIAFEPDRQMVCVGAGLTAELPVAWVSSPSSRLDDPAVRRIVDGARVCTMGSSFHWMDRPAVAIALDEILEAGGGIAVLSSGESVWRGPGSGGTWRAGPRAAAVESPGEGPRAGQSPYSHPPKQHQEVLAESPFSDVEVRTFTWSRRIDIDGIIGLQLSTSYASPRLLGDRVAEFSETLSERLMAFEPSGSFTGEETCELIVARRP